MDWLTTTRVRRWRQHRHTLGHGHVYQGRLKRFPIEADQHLLVASRCVERSAPRAGLVERAEDWRWCSPRRRVRGSEDAGSILSAWPIERPADWLAWVNQPRKQTELEANQSSATRGTSARRGRPFGDPGWQR